MIHFGIRTKLKRLRSRLGRTKRILKTRWRYRITIQRIRSKPKAEKIRVLFLNSSTSKWKCQTVYQKMEESGMFEPIIGITALGEQSSYSDSELADVFAASEQFFDALGDRHVRTVDLNPKRYRDLAEFAPDIVFFPEPWMTKHPQTTAFVSQFALTCYVPYFVFTQSNPEKHCDLEMHRFLARYFILNESIAREYSKAHSWWRQSFDFVVTGHPALDGVVEDSSPNDGGGCVIYAPHHSVWEGQIGLSIPISTFLSTGDAILEYAKKHPEIEWVFKPHPRLRRSLESEHFWSKERIDAYFHEWEALATACYDGSYASLFKRSSAMITDCDSFLAEYGATGKPIIHLRRNDISPQYHPYIKDLLECYYQVFSAEDMQSTFKLVLECREDPKKDERLAALRKAGLYGVNAAQNIVDYLRKELRR
jgi:hypothetical protein